jgi:hypothetical protein
MEAPNLIFISFALKYAKTNGFVKKYLDSYLKICEDFGIPDIHNPYAYDYKFRNKEHIITKALDMLKESLNFVIF